MSAGNIVGFEEKAVTVEETAGVLTIPVKRWGDLSDALSVRCYTRSRSAKGGSDYVERAADSEDSVVEFSSGEFGSLMKFRGTTAKVQILDYMHRKVK